jgi:hypothetical protein
VFAGAVFAWSGSAIVLSDSQYASRALSEFHGWTRISSYMGGFQQGGELVSKYGCVSTRALGMSSAGGCSRTHYDNTSLSISAHGSPADPD